MEKIDLKKQWKHLYQPRAGVIAAIEVPPLAYLMIDGQGDPNTAPVFQEAVEALFALSYTLKFAIKKGPRAIDYGVMPLEGLWWADDPKSFYLAEKSKWKWTAMIAQPEFVGQAEVDAAFAAANKKKNLPALDRVRFETLDEGASVQVLYVGSFADEGPTIQRLHDFIDSSRKKLHGKHHEIYLNDKRRTAPEKLKTILRQPMR